MRYVGIILRFEPVLNPKRTEPGVRFEVREIARTEPEVRFGVRKFLEKTEPNRTPATLNETQSSGSQVLVRHPRADGSLMIGLSRAHEFCLNLLFWAREYTIL
jgi:hypothetical protein